MFRQMCLVLVLQWSGSQYNWPDFRAWGAIMSLASSSALTWNGYSAAGSNDVPPRVILAEAVAIGAVFVTQLSMAQRGIRLLMVAYQSLAQRVCRRFTRQDSAPKFAQASTETWV